MTRISGEGIDDADETLPAPSPPLPAADSYEIDQVTPTPVYLDAVEAARRAVRNGRLVKAVIAREITVTSSRPFDRHGVMQRLKASFGSSYRFAVDGFFGASPELLVAVDGRTVTSHPLAGTAPRAGDPDRDAAIAKALIESTKNQVEHRAVIDMVHDTLLPWCSYLDWEPEPSIVTVANVQHLGTRLEGQLSSPPPNVIDARQGAHADARARRSPRPRGAGADRRGRARRSRPLRRRRRLGRRPRQRRVRGGDPLRPAVRRRHASPGCTPAAASSPTATRSPSSPRPRPSSKPCSRPSSAPERTHSYHAGYGDFERVGRPTDRLERDVRGARRPDPAGDPRPPRPGDASVTELCEPFAMSQPAISKHLKVLERAGLVSRRRDAQRRPCRLQARPLAEATEWLAEYRRFWEGSFERLDDLLAESSPRSRAERG